MSQISNENNDTSMDEEKKLLDDLFNREQALLKGNNSRDPKQGVANSENPQAANNLDGGEGNSFIYKLEEVKRKHEIQQKEEGRALSIAQYNAIKQQEQEIQKINSEKMQRDQQLQKDIEGAKSGPSKSQKIAQSLEDSADEEFQKSRKKPQLEVQKGLIVKEKALPAHTLIRRKALSILKYN